MQKEKQDNDISAKREGERILQKSSEGKKEEYTEGCQCDWQLTYRRTDRSTITPEAGNVKLLAQLVLQKQLACKRYRIDMLLTSPVGREAMEKGPPTTNSI